MAQQRERYLIGPGLRDKLREVITRVDGTPIGAQGGETVPVRLQTMMPRGGGGVVEAFYTGGWQKGAEKQITFLSNTASTALAVNLLRTVPLVTGNVPTARLCTVSTRSFQPTGTSATYVLVNSEC